MDLLRRDSRAYRKMIFLELGGLPIQRTKLPLFASAQGTENIETISERAFKIILINFLKVHSTRYLNESVQIDKQKTQSHARLGVNSRYYEEMNKNQNQYMQAIKCPCGDCHASIPATLFQIHDEDIHMHNFGVAESNDNFRADTC